MRIRLVTLIGLLTFIASLITFIPGTAQAALTLNNFVGFETNGLDEALSTTGSPALVTSPLRSGDFALQLNASARYQAPIITGDSVDSDNDFVMGFGYYPDGIPGATASILAIIDDAGGIALHLRIRSDGTLEVLDKAASSVGTSSLALSEDIWQYIEIVWQHSVIGTADVYVDGISYISIASANFDAGGAFGTDDAVYELRGVSTGILAYFDDLYSYTGGTGTGDFLGDAEVFRYQANTNSTTADRGCPTESQAVLDQGVWQDLGETPLSSDATEPGYTGGAASGAIDTEDTQSGDNFRHGPHGDEANIDGTIQGAKWLHRLRRDNGSGTTHRKCYGNSGDGVAEATVTLAVTFANFITISEVASEVPLVTEHFSHGFAKSAGGREIFPEEIWAFILHVPAGVSRRIFRDE